MSLFAQPVAFCAGFFRVSVFSHPRPGGLENRFTFGRWSPAFRLFRIARAPAKNPGVRSRVLLLSSLSADPVPAEFLLPRARHFPTLTRPPQNGGVGTDDAEPQPR